MFTMKTSLRILSAYYAEWELLANGIVVQRGTVQI
jgi:hypothetical protein